MLPQTPVFLINANAPSTSTPTPGTKQKTWIRRRKKTKSYSSTQYTDIKYIILNSFQLKLVKFTKKINKTKTKKLCKHTMSLLNWTEETIKIPNKTSASTPCQVKFYRF